MNILVDTVGKRHLSRGPRPRTRFELDAFRCDFNLEVGWFEFLHGKTDQERQNCIAVNCHYYHRPMSSVLIPQADDLRDLVKEIANALTIGNVLVHCEHGEDRTGIVCAAYRIIRNGWTAKRAKNEMYDLGFNYWFYFGWVSVLDQLYAEQRENQRCLDLTT